jgi:antitoxin (DNA-binding transcriptional repressor) of toxin-antitoxin stability system
LAKGGTAQFQYPPCQTHLSRLVGEVANGEPFVIAKAAKPMAQVIPISADNKPKRRIGFMKGGYMLPENFEEIDKQLDKEIEDLFPGRMSDEISPRHSLHPVAAD